MRFVPGIMATPKGTGGVPTQQSLFNGVTPADTTFNESHAGGINFGLMFTVSAAVQSIKSIAFYKTFAEATFSASVALWRIDGGSSTLIERKDFTAAAGTGWKTINLTTPYTASTSHGYVAHYWLGNDPAVPTNVYYAASGTVIFDAADVVSSPHPFIIGVKNDGLTHANGFVKRNNLYRYGTFAFPDSYFGWSFAADVVVTGLA